VLLVTWPSSNGGLSERLLARRTTVGFDGGASGQAAGAARQHKPGDPAVLPTKSKRRDEKGLAHLAILLRRVRAAAGDGGGGNVRWRWPGGDGSRLRWTEPRSHGGCRDVARELPKVEAVALRGGGCGVAVSLGRHTRRRRRHRGGVHTEPGSGHNETVNRTHMAAPSSRTRDKAEIARREADGWTKPIVAPKIVYSLVFFIVVGDTKVKCQIIEESFF